MVCFNTFLFIKNKNFLFFYLTSTDFSCILDIEVIEHFLTSVKLEKLICNAQNNVQKGVKLCIDFHGILF